MIIRYIGIRTKFGWAIKDLLTGEIEPNIYSAFPQIFPTWNRIKTVLGYRNTVKE